MLTNVKSFLKGQITERKLINIKESKVSFVQLIGFCLIAIGAVYFLYLLSRPVDTNNMHFNGDKVAITFFIMMFGMSLAFPSLLKDNNRGLSTMRLVVFMMVNVICMLLIKTGWNSNDLGEIGLDEYWVGIIAFVFGTKATQAYFESKLAAIRSKDNKDNPSNEESTNLLKATPEIIAESIKIKGKEWVESFPNVIGISVGNKTTGTEEKDDYSIIFKVINKSSSLEYGTIPKLINYIAKDGKKYKIITDIVQQKPPHSNSVKIDKPPFQLGSSVSRDSDDSTGTLGLLIKRENDTDTEYLISCYHIFCAPELRLNNKTFSGIEDARIRCASNQDNGNNLIGSVIEGLMNDESDFAISKINKDIVFENNIFGWDVTPKDFTWVLPEDKNKEVRLCGRSSGMITGKIKSHFAYQKVFYFNGSIMQDFVGLVELTKMSTGGDSGAAVLDENNQIIGLLIASNEESSFVLPVRDYLLSRGYGL